jgi:hypothetical protein
VDAAPQGGGDAGFSKLEVGNTKAEVTDTGSDGTFTVTTEGTGRLSVDSSGRTLLGGVTANADGGVLQLSSGITFPATAVAATDPNTLDDYEEGTWTPVFNATGGTFSTLSNVARYTKIGNIVKLSGYCQIYCSAGSGANAVTITGLPFTTANIGNMYQGGMLGNPNYFDATGYGLSAFIAPNTTTIDLNKFTDVGGSKRFETLKSQDITNANFSFVWTLVYQTA